MQIDLNIDLLPNVKMTNSFVGRYKTHHGTTYEVNLNTGLKITKVSNIHCPVDPYLSFDKNWTKEQWPDIERFVLLHRFVLNESSKITFYLK